MKIPEGYEIDEDKSTFVFKKIKKELPKRWMELEEVEGYCVSSFSKLRYFDTITCYNESTNTFKTKEQAEASIVLAQLSQLRDVYRDGWIPDWNNDNEKYIIRFYRDKIDMQYICNSNYFLSFQDAKTRDLFLENFIDLIEKVKPLMS